MATINHLRPATLAWSRFTAIALQLLAAAAIASPALAARSDVPGFRKAVARAAPSVVTVLSARVVKRAGGGAGRNAVALGLGSGVVIDGDGLIVTNNHVVEDADEVAIALPDGTVRAAQRIASDPDTDIALIKVDPQGLKPIQTGDIADVAVGDIVLAIGNPLGVGETVTQGIVGALRAVAVRDRVIDNIIQTDAALSPGNSGGALVDTQGRLIGLNCVIVSMTGGSEGIGFAIPVDVVMKVVRHLETNPESGAWLGLLMGRSAHNEGARVLAIEAGAPADETGVEAGDTVVRLAGKAVATPADVTEALQSLAPGARTDLCVRRGAERACTDVVLRKRPESRGDMKLLGSVMRVGDPQ